VMRLLFERWGETPYPDTAFTDIVEEVAGEQTKAWLMPLLETPAELDVDEALSWFGLVLDRHPVNNAARLVNAPLMTGFGVNWDSEKPGLVIKNVISGMGGSAAGLLPEDELLAINQERVTIENINDRLTRLQPGTDVSLLISRKNLIMNVDLTLEEARPASYEIRLNPDFGKRELRHMESWLGQSLQTDSN
jgi:predicted metalloprotease with PDZ domain